MPNYSYACTDCGDRFDAVQAFTDDALTECVKCAGRLRKLFNSVGVVFKGSGFYRTDSREAAKSSVGKSESKSQGSSSTEKSTANASEKTAGGSSEKSASPAPAATASS